MKPQNYIIAVLVTLLTASGLQAQVSTPILPPGGNDGQVSSTIRKNPLLDGHWHLDLGSSMMYTPGIGGLTGFSVTPVYSLPLSGRLALHGGVSFTRFAGPAMALMQDPGMNNIPGGMVTMFGSASYKLNDHILLYGTGVKHLGKMPALLPFPSYNLSDSFTVGSMFKLGDHLTIGASFRMNGNSPYNFNPYNPFDQYNPGYSPFTPWP